MMSVEVLFRVCYRHVSRDTIIHCKILRYVCSLQHKQFIRGQVWEEQIFTATAERIRGAALTWKCRHVYVTREGFEMTDCFVSCRIQYDVHLNLDGCVLLLLVHLASHAASCYSSGMSVAHTA
jgi:hypothetical protein